MIDVIEAAVDILRTWRHQIVTDHQVFSLVSAPLSEWSSNSRVTPSCVREWGLSWAFR